MSHRRLTRSAAIGLAIAALAAPTAAAKQQDLRSPDARDAASVAQTPPDLRSPDARDAALAQERYYSSYGEPETSDAGTAAAEAQERYYSSYAEPEPLTVAQSPEPSDETPWLAIALSVAGALAIVTVSATHGHRLRTRRRAARVTT